MKISVAPKGAGGFDRRQFPAGLKNQLPPAKAGGYHMLNYVYMCRGLPLYCWVTSIMERL